MRKNVIADFGRPADTVTCRRLTSLTPAPDPDVETVVAPYALVRSTALSLPSSSDVTRFRRDVGRLAALVAWCADVRTELGDELHDLIADAAPDLRNRLLLPLRRDVHNQRTPRSSLRHRLSELPQRVPLLEEWLSTRDEIEQIRSELGEVSESALAADRRMLAELCSTEALKRAVSLTSSDLLHAVERAAAQGSTPDARARKSEATVLRYAMRGVTKTTPLSWFVHVGWGTWENDSAAADGRAAAGTGFAPVAAAQADRAALDALVRAVLDRRDLRDRLPHRVASALRSDGTRVYFRRPAAIDDATPGLAGEEEVTLPLTAPLRHVLAQLRAAGTVLPRTLAMEVASRLPGPTDRARQASTAYVDALADHRVIRPAWPIDPQSTDAAGEVARWLADVGLRELASVVADIATQTAAFGQVPAGDRTEALARLRSRWADAFSVLKSERQGRRMPVTEDVTVRDVLSLDSAHGRDVLPRLTDLLPLFEIFDQFTVMRRAARDRFVAQFGAGGSSDSLSEFAIEYTELWRNLELFDPERVLTAEERRQLGPALLELIRIREDLAAAIPATGADGEIQLPGHLVAEARRRLPGWVLARPASYAVFAQPVRTATDTRLCVNHVYGGWGRFTSRFLGYLGPVAADQVSRQIRRGSAADARITQIRPVNGFNANLHPLLTGEEIADEAPWGTLMPEELGLVHDIDSDQLRVRVVHTGELIDVHYLGFLMPLALPGRLTPLVLDLGSGLVNLTNALVPGQERDTPLGRIRSWPRLRHHDVILSRARWRLSPSMVQAWRDELDGESGLPLRAAARWRGILRLPERVFMSAAPADGPRALEKAMAYFGQARSQYVDLGSALHLRCLSRTLARYPQGVILEEALPEPQAGVPATEVVAEVYRR